MLKTIESEIHDIREIHPDITPELMPGTPVLTASLALPENVPTLEVKVAEIQKREQEPVEEEIECWCGKDTICSNCLKENQIRRSAGKKGFYFRGKLFGNKPGKETK